MKHTIKWVEENIGISRKAIRFYEERGVLDPAKSRNPLNNYREYDDEDLCRIWCIKLLQSIGYSVGEIAEIVRDGDWDFSASIAEKITQLEEEQAELDRCIEYAKTIRLTGRIPTLKDVGSMHYEDFLKVVRDEWNIYADPEFSAAAKVVDKAESADASKEIVSLLGAFDQEKLYDFITYDVYVRMLADLQGVGASPENVLYLVKAFHKSYCEAYMDPEEAPKLTPRRFADCLTPGFTYSGIYEANKKKYGEEGCKFIAEALEMYGNT